MYRRSEVLLLALLLFALSATAQMPTSPSPAGVGSTMSGVPMHGTGGGGSVELSVMSDNNARLDRVAVVKLYDERTKFSAAQMTPKNSVVTFDQLETGKYDFEVTAVGYLTGRKDVEVVGMRPVKVEVVLHPDPDAVDFSGGTDTSLSPKAAKETDKALADLKSGNWKDAQKHLESALKEAPNSSRVNFLLGFAAFQQNSFDPAQVYLAKAASLDAHNVQALNLQSRLYLARKDFPAAKSSAEQAVAADPENATAHGLLADAYLNQTDYKNALSQADLALEKGKNHASNSQIIRGEALGNMGRSQEAIEALKLYLESAPDTSAGPLVKQWIEILEKRQAAAPSAPPAKQ